LNNPPYLFLLEHTPRAEFDLPRSLKNLPLSPKNHSQLRIWRMSRGNSSSGTIHLRRADRRRWLRVGKLRKNTQFADRRGRNCDRRHEIPNRRSENTLKDSCGLQILICCSLSAVRFAVNLHRHHGMPLSRAYATSLAQFRSLRSEQEVANTIATLEAEYYGAEFGPTETERGFNKMEGCC